MNPSTDQKKAKLNPFNAISNWIATATRAASNSSLHAGLVKNQVEADKLLVKMEAEHAALEAAALALDAVLAGTAWHQIEQKALEAAKAASAAVEKVREGKAVKS